MDCTKQGKLCKIFIACKKRSETISRKNSCGKYLEYVKRNRNIHRSKNNSKNKQLQINYYYCTSKQVCRIFLRLGFQYNSSRILRSWKKHIQGIRSCD